MNRAPLNEVKTQAQVPGRTARTVHGIVFAGFIAQFVVVWARLWVPFPFLGEAAWPEGLLLVLAVATTLLSLTLELPGQNVLLAAVVIAVVGSAVQSLGPLAGVPFGPDTYTDSFGWQLFHTLPWPVPLLWILVILTARGVARLILRPWQGTKYYGLWVLGVTTCLAVLFEFGFEPYATTVKHFWSWHPAKTNAAWYAAPWVSFVGYGITVVIILAFVTPILINKKPEDQPPGFHPLIVWILLNCLLGTTAAKHELWPACVVISFSTLGPAILGLNRNRKGRLRSSG